MEDQKTVVSNDNINASSKDAGKNAEQKSSDQQVSYDSFNKLLGQHKNSKAENESLKEKLTLLEQQEQQRLEKELAAQGEWKLLVEAKEKKIAELEAKRLEAEKQAETANSTLTNAQKIQAVCDKLPGRIRNSKYYQYIDIDQVAFNPETGEVDEASVQLVANSFMEEHKELVDTTHIGRLPAGNASSSKTPSFKDLSLSEMRKNMKQHIQERIKKM